MRACVCVYIYVTSSKPEMATKAKLQEPAVLKDSEAPYGKKQKTNAAFKTDRGPAYIYIYIYI